MQIEKPFLITSRLMLGFRLGGAEVSFGYSKQAGDCGRTRYEWIIDLGKKTFRGDDIQSGCNGGSLAAGLGSLLSFLGAAGESMDYETRSGRPGDNAGLFPRPVAEWASANSDGLGMMALELEETPELIVE